MLKHKKPALLLTLGTAIALVAGGTFAYWMTEQQRPTSELPVGANIVPQEALMTLTFSTDKRQWRRLRELGTPDSRVVLDRNLVQLRDRLLAENGLDYQRDVEPWVGQEITLAFVPPVQPTANDAAPNASPDLGVDEPQPKVMVLPIADPAQAQRTLQASGRIEQKVIAERDYKGLQIRELQGEGNQTYATAVLDGRFLVITTEAQALEQVIDTYRGGDSVAEIPGYTQSFRKLTAAQPFMRVYVNVPATSAAAAENASQLPNAGGIRPLQKSRGLALSVMLDARSVQIQGVSWLDPRSETRYKVSQSGNQLPNLLPEETIAMASGSDLQQLWTDYSQPSSQPSEATVSNPPPPTHALSRNFRSLTGLDLEQDFLTWMNGEFSLAILTSPAPGAQEPVIGAVLMVQASDRQAAEQALARLDQAISTRYSFQIRGSEIAGQPVINWVSPFAALTGTRGWLENDVAFLAIGSTTAATLVPAPSKTLAENVLFRDTATPELTTHNGHFFLDFERLRQSQGSLPLPSFPPDARAVSGAIRAIGVTSTVQDERTTRFNVNVLLERSGNPGALPAPTVSPAPAPTPPT